MITRKASSRISYIVLAIMAAMLVLVYFRFVPESWTWTLFSIVLILFMLHVTLRLLVARQERSGRDKEESGSAPTSGSPQD
jgi:predicted MFS family arabinose efflux permease